ncbi:MAG: bifunctional folylpolyglutamate synthase/dihydrofolate synthase [Verrucomicrobiales bacterium]|nr:bifunctional folylpolyglutamate synthase/dihydrofolate synthase [Verrucomicrobiales bacterium]
MDYSSSISWLYGIQMFGIKLGLGNMERLLAALRLPRRGQRFLHVAGTNGKGSVCAMLDAICQEAGMRSGLFTSPHLISFCERMKINGVRIPEHEAAARISRLKSLVEAWEPHPTFFELATALALDWFTAEETDIMVLETGMGGRLDATNAITPLASVIAPIAMDHEQWLGGTLAEIAAEKAGIIKPGVPVVSAPQHPDAAGVLLRTAEERGSPLQFVTAPWTQSPVALAGSHQQWNASLAVAALDAAGLGIPHAAVERGLANVRWPARFQRISQGLVLDGAHNPHGARMLAEVWRQQFPEEMATVIFGAVAAKDIAGVLREIAPIAARLLLVPLRTSRGMTVGELESVCRVVAPHLPCAGFPDVASAVESARQSGQKTLVTGSLYLCGEVLSLLEDGLRFEPSSQ